MVISFYPQILSGDFFVELNQNQFKFQLCNLFSTPALKWYNNHSCFMQI